MLPGILIIVVVTLIIWSLGFLYIRNYLNRRTGSRRILAEFQEEVDKLIAEINSATDRGLTLMEDRISSLKTLLEETDKRIVTYKREMERRRMHEDAYAELGKKTVVKTDDSIPPLNISRDPPAVPEPEKIPESQDLPAEETLTSRPAENSTRALSNEGPRFVRSSIRVEPKAPPFADQVIHLANAGFSKELIANHLGTTVAEVDLVIALAERNRDPQS